MMLKMDEAGVPESGRILYITPATNVLLKQATTRYMLNGQADIQRIVRSIDNVTIVTVPTDRMKTVYDFTEGFVPGVGARQIDMALVYPPGVVAPIKRSVIYLFGPGEQTQVDGWLYQNRLYTDLFVFPNKAVTVQLSVAPASP